MPGSILHLYRGVCWMKTLLIKSHFPSFVFAEGETDLLEMHAFRVQFNLIDRVHLEFKSVECRRRSHTTEKKQFFFWFMVLSRRITSPCAADERITGASLPRRREQRPVSASLVVMKQGIQHQQVRGANTEICRMAWQVFDEEIHHNRCGFVIFLTVTIPAAFRGSDWNSLPGALHTHATPHEWLAPPLLCYKKKKKNEWPTFSLCSRNIWRDIALFSQQLCNQWRVLKSYCSVALLELEWYNSFSLDYYTK